MNVIGLKKCPKCGFKELYGCHNYYTIGAPFICPQCGTTMDFAPFKYSIDHVSDEEYQKTWNLLQRNLATLDFITKPKDKKGTVTLEWVGIEKP